MKQIRMYLLTI